MKTMLNFDHNWGQRGFHQQEQQRRSRIARQRAQQQLNQARNASRQQSYPDLLKQQRQSTAKKYSDEVPEALMRNLDETRGHPTLAMLLDCRAGAGRALDQHLVPNIFGGQRGVC